jgi:hypothetical protein
MARNIYNNIDAGFVEKWISVKQLKSILNTLQDDDLLYPNRVGNLSVVREDVQIGYIDISDEKYEAD